MATQHNFRIKNGLEVGGVLIVDSSGQLQATTISGAISATSIGVTNIVTNKVVKFNGSILDDSNITDTGSLITLGSNTTVSGTISSGAITASAAVAATQMFINTPDSGSSPAMTALLKIYGYEGRGAGIKIRDSVNSAAGSSNREWFIGSGYNQSGFNIGYSATGSQSSYTAQNKFLLDTSGNATFAGTITGTAITGTTATFIANAAAGTNALNILGLTNGNGTGITFSDNGSPGASASGQNGYMYYYHGDGQSYGSGNAFILTSSESTTTILADGKLMYKEGIYSKPASGTGAGTRKDANWDTAYGWGDHGTQSYATQTYVGTQITNLIDSSPSALNTLNELAAAIGDDANFSTTVTNNIASKVSKSGDTITSGTNVGLTINHDTFGAGLRLHRNHASNASSIQFINNGGRQGTLLGIASDNGLYWQIGTSTTNNKIFHDTYHPNADTWTTARNLVVTLTGDVTGTATQSVNGSAGKTWSIATTVANNSHTHNNLTNYVLKAGDTMTGKLTLNDAGYSLGNEYHKWKRAYTVTTSSPQEILYSDGNSLPTGGVYRFTAHISGTGTDQFATAVYWNQNGTWRVNVTGQSGTSSNHPEFIIDGTTNKPTIYIDHTSSYGIHILGERIELDEGTGTDNAGYAFGTDAFLGSVNNNLYFLPGGTAATGQNSYDDGNVVWHTGNLTTTNKSNYDTAYTYSQVGHLPLAGGTLTGNITAPAFVQSGSSGNSFYGASFTRSASSTTTPDIWGANGTLVLGTSSSVESVGFSGANAQFYGTITSGAITTTGKFIQDANGAVNSLEIYDDSASGQPGIYITDAASSPTKEFYVKTYGSSVASTIFGSSITNKSIVATTGSSSAGLLLGTLTADPLIIGTGNAAKITIPASGNITFHSQNLTGIGTISSGAITSTVVNTGDATFLTLHHDTGADIAQQKSFIDFSFEDDNTNETPQVRIGAEVGQNNNADSQIKEGSGAFVVYTNNANTDAGAAGTSLAERMRVDYQGNVLIGKTASDFATAGAELAKDGTPGKVQFSRSSNPLSLNNITNNGNIISFYKGAGAVGDIGIEGGDSLYIQSGTTSGSGLRFHPSAGTVEPVRNGITIHNTINLGSATRQFKDAYFEKVYVRQNTTQTGAVLEFSDEPSSWSQNGSITFRHVDTACYGSGAMFEIGSDQATTTILAQGKLYFSEGLYTKPASGTGVGTLRISSSGNATLGTISSGAITSTGNVSLNQADGFVYLNNQGVGNAGIYVRGITSSSTLRSHSTNNFRWEVTGGQKMELNSSGVLNAVGGYQVNSTTVIDASRNVITGSNFYFGATNSSLLAKDGANIRYLADGIHKFETYNGGWSERVRIDDAGLDVTGTISSGTITSTGTSVFDRIKTGLGTVASPAVQVGDNDSGFYDSGANIVGVALGGVLEYEFEPTQFDMKANNLVGGGTATFAGKVIMGGDGAIAQVANSIAADTSNTYTLAVGSQSGDKSIIAARDINTSGGSYQIAGTDVINSSREVLAHQYYYLNAKIMAQGTDQYLRINQSNQFTDGTWFGNSNIYNSSSKYIASGSNGGTTSSRVYMYGGSYNGQNVIALDGTDGKIKGSYYAVGASTVIDGSRNLTNIGTISATEITAGKFVAKQLTGSGIGSSYDERVVLLCPKVETNNSYTNIVNGKLVALKTGGNVCDSFDIFVHSVYNDTRASFVSSGQRTNHKFVTCTYGGIKWVAIKFGYTANPYNYFQFEGVAQTNFPSNGGNQLKVISYYDTQSGGTVLNAEINNSIADYNPDNTYTVFENGSTTFNSPISVLSSITSSGTITASGGNSGNWNTAYGWGNHASGGYYAASNPNGYTGNTGTMIETGTSFSGTYPVSFRIGANSYYSNSGMTFTGSTNTLSVTGSITVGGTVDGVDIAARNAVLTSTTTTANAALPKAGGTMSGTLTMNGNAISMGNGPISNANNLSFNDPGPSEGVKWEGGSLWQIYESPDNLTTNSGGNLQFTSGSGNGTRRMTLNTSGDLYVQGDISMAGLYTGSWANSTSHSVGRIGQVSDRVAGSITNQIGGSTSAKWEVVDYGWNTVLLNCTNAGDFTASSSVRSTGGNYYGNQAASVQYRGYGDNPILTGVNGATYLYAGGSTGVALTLQAGRTVAPILSIGQVNSYSDVITSARAVQNITSIAMSGNLLMSKSQPWLIIENTTEDSGGIVFNDNQAGAATTSGPPTSSQAFRMAYNSGAGNAMTMGHDDDSYGGFTFAIGGNFTASGNITAYSDERLKENIQTLDSKKTLQMRGVSFTKDGKESSGVIAQEIEKIAPELVQTNEQDGYKSVAYGNLVGYLIETVKDQQKQIDDLKELINNIIKSNSKEN
jgi:hypothetical protein